MKATSPTGRYRGSAAVPASLAAALAITALLLSACSSKSEAKVAAATSSTTSKPAAASTTTTTRPVQLTGTFKLDPAKGPAGTAVRASGAGLPANLPLRMVWTTSVCKWVLKGEQQEEYHGRSCAAKDVDLAQLRSDGAGAVNASFVVPDDFGFAHDVLLIAPDGVVRNRALFDMSIEVSVHPDRGPVGTPITVTVKGMGIEALENNRQILYDNGYTGWLSAITTKGTGVAVIPATGAPGLHMIQIARGAFTFPYLNPAQSPRPDIPVFQFPFTVTDGPAVLPAAPDAQSPKPVPRVAAGPAAGAAGGRSISADVASAPVGAMVTLRGAGFPGGSDVALQWFRIVGNRVGGQGWDEQSLDLPAAKTSADGTFVATFAVPGDVGGPHRIEAATAGGPTVSTSVSVTPTALALSPASGPAGSTFNINLTGVGWTETANIYTVVYDNRYIGYACGFNSQGSVTIPMIATGAPGWHFIDLYPAIYKGEEKGGQQSFRIPQLTFTDHPGEKLPAFHYAFLVEG